MLSKIIRVPAVLVSLALAPGVFAASPTNDSGVVERVWFYADMLRIKWKLPRNDDFLLKPAWGEWAPQCNSKATLDETGHIRTRGACEINVFPRDLTVDPEEIKNNFFSGVRFELRDIVNALIEIQSYGAIKPVYYATVKDTRSTESWTYLTVGIYVRGPFVIKFRHTSSDATGIDLRRVLQVVSSAEPLDTLLLFSWKLSDYKTICEERFPEFKQPNDAAFSNSKFASVDLLRLMYSAIASETSGPVPDLAPHLADRRAELRKKFSDGSVEEWEAFCRAYPRQVKEAERAL